MILQEWFSVPIWYKELILSDTTLEQVKKTCYEIKSRDAGRVISNFGGWQSNDIYAKSFREYFPLELMDQITNCFKHCFEQLSIDPKQEFNLTNGWININSLNNYNIPHEHPMSVLSGVFYLTKGNKIVFERPHGDMSFFLDNVVNSSRKSKLSAGQVFYEPFPKRLIIFPSWLRHSVEPCENNLDRISIAFNTNITDKYDNV